MLFASVAWKTTMGSGRCSVFEQVLANYGHAWSWIIAILALVIPKKRLCPQLDTLPPPKKSLRTKLAQFAFGHSFKRL
jgi:hypothetical protein